MYKHRRSFCDVSIGSVLEDFELARLHQNSISHDWVTAMLIVVMLQAKIVKSRVNGTEVSFFL